MTSESIVPRVPYASYDEFKMLRTGLRHDYHNMVRTGLDIVKDKLWSWEQYHCECSDGVFLHWLGEGAKLWLKFTKGQGELWCEQKSHHLVRELRLVCGTSFSIWKIFSERWRTNEEIYNFLLPQLMAVIDDFVSDCVRGEPHHLDSLQNENFTYTDDNELIPIPLTCSNPDGPTTPLDPLPAP